LHELGLSLDFILRMNLKPLSRILLSSLLLAPTVVAQTSAAPVPFNAPPAETKAVAALPLIAVQGNRFVNPAGETVIFRGLALCDPAVLAKKGQWGRRYFEEAAKWHANVVRIPVHPADWRRLGEAAYLKMLDEAVLHGMKVLLVNGIDLGMSAADPYGGGYVLEQLQSAGRSALDEAAAVAAARGVEAEVRLETGSPAYALVDASKGAALLVVGSRGHGGFAGLLLGSVSVACVHHAHCPVVVVRPVDDAKD
jgi:nucleotide-binding universal stress UspA family protein